jgi:hypothetical protein
MKLSLICLGTIMMNMLRHAQMAYHREGGERLFKLKVFVWSAAELINELNQMK